MLANLLSGEVLLPGLHTHIYSHMTERREESSCASSYKSTNVIHEIPTAIAITLGVGISTYEFCGRHNQSNTGGKKIVHANTKQKRAWTAILLTDIINYKPEIVTWNKGRHYILIKGWTHKEI